MEREYQELLWGINTSTLANHSFNPPKKAYQPFDFMPIKIREKAMSKPKKRWTRRKFAEELVAVRSAMPHHFIIVNDPAPVVSTDSTTTLPT